MIVLDEQLLGRGLDRAIGQWYRGSVIFINELRPNSVIKDDAIPHLLRLVGQPTFVTINTTDFWQRTQIDRHYCVVCCTLTDPQATIIPQLLRRLLHHPDFRAKAKRMGRVIRIGPAHAAYYTWTNRSVRTLEWWSSTPEETEG